MLSAAPLPEPAWVLWTRGLHGPEVAVLRCRGSGPQPSYLSEAEQTRALAPPRLMEQDDVVLPLSAVARLYPAPHA